jgi:hypothetical protein
LYGKSAAHHKYFFQIYNVISCHIMQAERIIGNETDWLHLQNKAAILITKYGILKNLLFNSIAISLAHSSILVLILSNKKTFFNSLLFRKRIFLIDHITNISIRFLYTYYRYKNFFSDNHVEKNSYMVFQNQMSK